MRIISWIFTITALVMIGACFFNDEIISLAFTFAVLAAWTDDWANDNELIKFMASNKGDES